MRVWSCSSPWSGTARQRGWWQVELESLVKVTRNYRRIMNWRTVGLQLESLAETMSTAESSHYLSQSDLLYKLELILHLVEILYLDSTPGAMVLPHLLH